MEIKFVDNIMIKGNKAFLFKGGEKWIFEIVEKIPPHYVIWQTLNIMKFDEYAPFYETLSDGTINLNTLKAVKLSKRDVYKLKMGGINGITNYTKARNILQEDTKFMFSRYDLKLAKEVIKIYKEIIDIPTEIGEFVSIENINMIYDILQSYLSDLTDPEKLRDKGYLASKDRKTYKDAVMACKSVVSNMKNQISRYTDYKVSSKSSNTMSENDLYKDLYKRGRIIQTNEQYLEEFGIITQQIIQIKDRIAVCVIINGKVIHCQYLDKIKGF